MIITRHIPSTDTVLFDGQCRFCRSQVALLRMLDFGNRFTFFSLHDPIVLRDYPEISTDELLSQMYVIDRVGSARGGVDAVKYLSRKLPLLWPLAGLLHIPGSMPLWRYLYRVVARNRMRFAGRCDDGHCRVN
ncbi:MAG: DUF393 domain-containing protein [Planctomycetota bacterium]|nr:MAG: DUF393 domain-containing protein [Planctomycetota bacterium]RLS28930.1 MAG: DUF393 domain-containing protein [Planctomycetota bacterium]